MHDEMNVADIKELPTLPEHPGS